MAARFRVSGTFTLSSRHNFVVVGDIVEGIVRTGMRLPLPSNAPAGCSGRIIGVEYVDSLRERVFKIGLRLAYASADELFFWKSVPVEGADVQLLDDAEPAA